MSRRSPKEPRPSAPARAAAALLALASVAAAQYGTVERQQKVASASGNLGGILGLDYRFGVSVADLGDFDGDGIRDVAVGAHRADIGGPERGAVWILCLAADGKVRKTYELSSRAGNLTGPLDDHDRFGISTCPLGDLDRDGTVDLAVGAYRDDDGDMDAGAVYLLFLTPDGTVKTEQKISALVGGLDTQLGAEDSFGWSVEAVDDLDQDGVMDLAVGATRDDGTNPDTSVDYGALYLLFLNPDGTVKGHTVIDSAPASMGLALKVRDRFGSDVVPLGDADGDGFEDLAVGAFGDDPLKYGKVFVLHLGPGGTLKSFQEIGKATGGFTGLLDTGDRFGISLAADDLDGDGLRDLYIGAPGDDDGGAEAGAVWVCLLNSLGRVRGVEKISARFGGFGGTLLPGDTFGISCTTIGDLDRDGAVDLAVGAYQDDEGGFDRGAAWVLFRAGVGLPVADFASAPGHGSAPLAVSFSDRSSGLITSRTWDFGDGESSSEANPAHTYATDGRFTVALTVRGPSGEDQQVQRDTILVETPSAPTADFVVTPSSGPAPLAVRFSDRSTGTVTSWSWDFGDGETSTLQNPVHTYEGRSNYTVRLTVSGFMGSSSETVPGAVSVAAPLPVANFSALPSAGSAPLTVAFSDLSTGGVTAWAWDFGDGTSATGPAPVHTYGLGTFDVKLTVTGPTGTTTLLQQGLIRATVPLNTNFTFTPTSGVAPISVQFTDRSDVLATSWRWDFGDGSAPSTAQNPAHVFQTGGTFPVTLSVTGAGRFGTRTTTMGITEPKPIARLSATPTSGPALLIVRFSDLSIGNIKAWEWDFGDGTTSTLENPLHAYKPGTYTVRLRVTSTGGVSGVMRKDLITVGPPLPPKSAPAEPPKTLGPVVVPSPTLALDVMRVLGRLLP